MNDCDTCDHWEEWHDTVDTRDLPVWPENPCLNCREIIHKNYKPKMKKKDPLIEAHIALNELLKEKGK